MSTTGRLYRSTRREATIPITPSCQSAPATAYARRARCSGVHLSTCAIASRRMRPSTAWRSLLSASSESARRRASFSSSVRRSSSAARGWPSLPAALRRGARRNPTAPASTLAGSTPAARMSARRPGFAVRASARSPAIAKERFSSTSGTTSAIVASATRSRCRLGTSESTPKSAWPSL